MASYSATSSSYFALILTSISINHVVGDYCQGYTDTYSGNFISGRYCPGIYDDYEKYKCCGPSDGQYCCNFEDYNNYYGSFYWSVGKIIGVVIGGLIGCVVLVIVIVAIVCCYARNLKRQQRQQQTVNASGSQLQAMTTRTTTTLDYAQPAHAQTYSHGQPTYQPHGQTYPQPVQNYPQHGQSYPQQHQPYPPQSYSKPDNSTYSQNQTFGIHGQVELPPAYTQVYPQQHGIGYSSPPVAYYAHEPAAATYAPELAPPPPSDT